jgi:hypothetical protein
MSMLRMYPLYPATAVLLLILAHPRAAPQNIPSGFGAIQGRVVNELGKPLPGAKVYVEPIDPKYAPVGKLRFVITNDDGNFVVGQAAPGGNFVCASKEEAFYPDTCAAALAADLGALPRVRVEEGKLTGGVTVPLSKGGKFTGTILDSQSSLPLINSRIRLSRNDDPRLYVSEGPDERGRFEFVIPTKPFKIEISAPGYKTWNSDNHGGTILVQPGFTKEITIRLERADGAMPN